MGEYRFLLTRRWIGLTILVIVLIPLFVLASSWQFQRLDDKRERNSAVRTALAEPIAPLESLASDGVDATERWRRVTTTGSYLQGSDVVVRRKSLDNNIGYWVVSPLLTTQGLVVPVVRGWIPMGTDALTPPTFRGPDEGRITITGRLGISEQRRGRAPTDLPSGQIDVLTPSDVTMWAAAGPVLDGFVELTAQQPPPSGSGVGMEPRPIPTPELSEGPHLSYAWQWRLFVLLAVIGWFVLVRSNVAREREDQALEPVS
jgi:cytochrome oxidase assembly protein ShyY1